MRTFFNRKLTISVCLAFGGLFAGRAQVQPLPVIPPDALVQTYTGRLAYTLLNGYVRNDDARLSDSRTPTGAAGGDLTGTYPNPTVKASVNLTGSPTATTPVTTANNTQIATTAYVKNNLASYIKTSDSRLSDSRTPTGAAGGDLTGTYPNPTVKRSVNLTGNPTVEGQLTVNGTGDNFFKGNLRLESDDFYGNKLNFGDGDYVYLQEETDDNLTVKAENIYLSATTTVTAPTPDTENNSTQIATTAYVKNNLANYVTTSDARLSDSRTPKGAAGGDLTGTYPNPTVKASVNLTGYPTATTPATTVNSTRIATTAYVKNNLASYVKTSDSRLSDSRAPNGTAGGDLTGTYPNPTVKASVNLTGSPTATTPATEDNSTKIATTAFVHNSQKHNFYNITDIILDWNYDSEVFFSTSQYIRIKIGDKLPVYSESYKSNRCDVIADVANTNASKIFLYFTLPSGTVKLTALNITVGKNYLVHVLSVRFSSGDPSIILTIEEKY